MSTVPGLQSAIFVAEHTASPRPLALPRFAAVAVLLGTLGLGTIWPTLLYFWHLWTTDALESIGMMVPGVSVFLLLRIWRSLGWRAAPNWWGLGILLFTTAAVRVGEQAVVMLNVTPHYAIILPPPQLVLVAYASGAVLLLGGTGLFRAALFPICLLVLANPVPHVFSSLVDLPLQQVSAHLARAFAFALGQLLTPDHLRLMFTPEFGMFIAPGCDGIRGSVTMGLAALIAGHMYRFRWYATALVVVGAVVLGYVFNLLRLCMLVLYYLVALHITPLQSRAEMGDYILGGVLFLLASWILFAVIHRLCNQDDMTATAVWAQPVAAGTAHYSPLVAMAALVLFGGIGLARANAFAPTLSGKADSPQVRRFPTKIGSYILQRSWDETYLTGGLVYAWAQYAPPGGDTPVAIGIAPGDKWHNPVYCHSTRGEIPVWQGQLAMTTADGPAVDFNSAFYADGAARFVEASTLCSGPSCGQITTDTKNFGVTYSSPDPASLLARTSQHVVPILLRAQTTDFEGPAELQRQSLTASLRGFVAATNLVDLTRPYRR